MHSEQPELIQRVCVLFDGTQLSNQPNNIKPSFALYMCACVRERERERERARERGSECVRTCVCVYIYKAADGVTYERRNIEKWIRLQLSTVQLYFYFLIFLSY